MKAWIVDDPIEAASAAVVFAETRGQAKVLAQSTDACEDMDFVDIRAVRAPKLDRFYRGKSEMDWFDPNDRILKLRKDLRELPSIQSEQKRGRWIYGEDEYGIDGYHCDKCGFFVPWDYTHKFINYIEDYNFCPLCGADMRGEQDGQ